MPETPVLKNFWNARRASWTQVQGRPVADFEPDRLEGYRAAQASAALFDFSSHGKIRVSGPDRHPFLHNLLTQDILSLSPGEGAHAFFLKGTGRILMEFHVFVFEDFILLEVETGFAGAAIELLEKYHITEDLVMEDVTDAFALVAIEGRQAAEIGRQMAGQWPEPSVPYLHETIQAGGIQARLLHHSLTGLPGFRLLVDAGKAETAAEWLLEQFESCGLRTAGYHEYEILRIENAVLRYGIDMTEDILLPEAGLEKTAASPTKGCYPGQEVVAKIETYGRLNRKFILNETGEDTGDRLIRVTSEIFSPARARKIQIELVKNPSRPSEHENP